MLDEPQGFPVASPVAVPERAAGEIDREKLASAFANAAAALAEIANALRGVQGQKPSENILPSAQTCLTSSLPEGISVIDAINEFLLSKARAKRSDRYLRTLRVSLGNFAQGRMRTSLAAITADAVEEWVFALGVAPRTMQGYFGDVQTFFHFAIRRGYAPALMKAALSAIELPEGDNSRAPGIHSAEQVRTVLEYVRRVNLDACRHLAVRYFTGIRSAETHRLREENILPGYIEVPGAKAKTKSRRLVTIHPNLRAWLDLGGELRGICPETLRKLVKGSGVEWTHNATRHSFCSYHLAMWDNAALTALQAGHTETQLFRHYRAVVTKEAAQAFWNVRPG